MQLKMSLAKIAILIGLILLASHVGAAELPPLGGFLPGSVLPEQISKAITKERTATQAEKLPPITEPGEKKPSALSEQAKKIKFQLNNIMIDGNQIYTDEQLETLYKNKLHKTISVADLFGIVQGITNYYRNNGYVISRAILPPQHVKNGIAHVQVIEGYIDDVQVTGDPRGSKCYVLALGNKIKQCPPLQIKRMEKYLLLANETPGTQVKAVLSPSKKQTGAANLTLVTQTRPNGYISYDNYGTRYIGPQQISANMTINSVISSGDSNSLTVTKTPRGGELTYIDINHTAPLYESVRWLIGSTRAQTHPLFVLQPVNIDGLNANSYIGLQFPHIRMRTKTLNWRIGFNYNDSWVTTFSDQLYTDHLRSLDLGGTFNFADRWYGANLISGDFRQGLPIMGYTSNTDPLTALTSRPGGRGKYTKIMLTLSRLQAIKGPFSMYALVTSQWAFMPLLAAEQFAYGGSQLGRGYDVAEIIGDRGLAASLEARFDLPVQKFTLSVVQLYLFYDAGEIWNILDIEGVEAKQSATSAGLGIRFYFTKFISGNFMWAQPLTKEIAAEELIGEGWRPRVFFSIVAALN